MGKNFKNAINIILKAMKINKKAMKKVFFFKCNGKNEKSIKKIQFGVIVTEYLR